MLADLLTTTSTTTTVPTPYVGTPTTSYRQQEWVAAAIVVVAFFVLVWLRRFAAAKAAQDGARLSNLSTVFFAFGSRKNKDKVPDFHGLLVGSDNRTSTSKTTAALWTIIVAYFLVAMALVLGFQYAHFQTLVGNTSPLYLIFLGGPFAAAIIAKSVVSGAVDNGDQQRSQANAPRVADVFSDDDGNTDLVDLQYVLFNLIVAGIVLTQFLHAPGFGAPVVPSFLAGLTSASAATYVANKGLTTSNAPSLDRFLPSSVRAGGRTVALGSNLVAPGSPSAPTVILGSAQAPDDAARNVKNTPPDPSSVAFEVPPGTPPGRVRVVVRSSPGAEASSDALAASDALTVVRDALVVSAASPI